MFIVIGVVCGVDIVDSVHETFEAARKRVDEYRAERPHSLGRVQFVARTTDASGAEHVVEAAPTLDGHHVGADGRVWSDEEHAAREAALQRMRDRRVRLATERSVMAAAAAKKKQKST